MDIENRHRENEPIKSGADKVYQGYQNIELSLGKITRDWYYIHYDDKDINFKRELFIYKENQLIFKRLMPNNWIIRAASQWPHKTFKNYIHT